MKRILVFASSCVLSGLMGVSSRADGNADPQGLVLHSVESISPLTFPSAELAPGEVGVVIGGLFCGTTDEDAVWGDLLESAGWSVVNLAGEDLAGWPKGIEGLSVRKGLSVVSANLRRRSGEVVPWKPYAILAAGGKRIAFVGILDPSSAQAPEAKALKDLDIVDPATVLSSLVPEVRKSADLVVLLAAMSRERAAAVLARSKGVDVCLVSARGSGDQEPIVLGGTSVCETPGGGLIEGRTEVRFAREGKVENVRHSFDSPAAAPSQKVAATRAKSHLPVDLVRAFVTKPEPGGGTQDGTALFAVNRACRISVISAVVRETHGALHAPAGRAFLVLDVELENILPLTLVCDQKLPTEYRIPVLGDHLYLVRDGSRVSRVYEKAEAIAGHLPAKDLRLQRLGSRLRGTVVFELPKHEDGARELRLYDFAHGHAVIPISRGASAPAQPATALRQNAVVEAGVYGLKRAQEVAGRKAADGKTFVIVDLRARSLLTVEADARAFDSGAKAGAKTRVGTVADWKESRKYVQLVADGEYAYPPLEQSELADEPRFLPDVMTGGDLVFEVPETVSSIELRCDFPNSDAQDAAARKPAGLTFALEGKRPAPPERKAIVSVDDEMFKVAVTGQRVAPEFSGEKAAEDSQFLVLDVTVANSAKGGEFFQTKAQLKYAAESGASVEMDAASGRGLHPAADIAWVPGGERRSFQVAYQIPAKDKRPRLLFSGAKAGQTLTLNPLAAGMPDVPQQATPDVVQQPKPPADAETPVAVAVEPAKPESAKPPEPTAPVAPAAVARVPPPLKGLPAVGTTNAFTATAANSGVRVSVSSLALVEGVGRFKATPGHAFLILQSEWENLSAAQLCVEVAEGLVAVADGGIALRVHERIGELGRHLDGRFWLKAKGAREAGALLFEAPADARALELRYYDPSHGIIVLPLAGPDRGPSVPDPIGALQQNAMLEAGVFGIERMPGRGERKAADGKTLAVVDFRGRSLLRSRKGDGPAWAEWDDALRHIELIVDGEYAYEPLKESAMPASPTFLPDIMTGGRLVFEIPRKTQSLELQCEFSRTGRDADDPKDAKPLTLAVEGTRPPLPERKAIAAVDDRAVKVAFSGQSVVDTVAGQRPEEESRWLLLDVTVANTGSRAVRFEPRNAIQYHDSNERQYRLHELSAGTACPPLASLWIPGGERRTFQTVMAIAAGEPQPRVYVEGVMEAKVLDLMPLAVPGAEEAAAARRVLPRVAARQDWAPQGLAGVGLTAEEVNRAIDRGTAYLWGQVKDGKVKGGELALSWQALIHAGAHKKIPECAEAARRYIEEYNVNEGGSYESGIFCMLVDAFGEPRYLPKLRAKARNLMEAQGPKGLWDYECRPLPREYTNAASRLGPADTWARLTPRHEGGDGDNSASQFGLLGMYAAARNGVKFERDVWMRNLQMARRRQGDDGGWAYTTRSSSYGSMTCAGVCAVALDRYHLGEPDPAADEAIDLGLGWLDAHFTVEVNPPNQSHHYYYLYSLERVGRILNTEFIGQHEWYPLGARFLVRSQKEDGRWIEGSDPILGTSFALLFLTRATPSLAQAPERRKDEKGRLQTLAAETGSMRLYVILDASGSMLEEMDGKQKFQIAKDALTGLIEALPDTAEVGLRVYGHTKRAIDQGANEDTKLELAMGRLDKAGLLQTVAGLRARGKTPLALSLREAAHDLAGAGSEDKPVTVVLLTDGMEDTFPRQDPLKAADEFAQVKNVKLHVVGFDIGRADWAEALAALTARAKGQYWPAPRADKLSAKLRAAARGIPDDYTLLDKDGQAVGAGTYGDTQILAPGEYRLTAALGERVYEQNFAIQPGLTTRLSFDSARAVTNAVAAAAPSTAPAVAPPVPAAAKESPAGAAAAPKAKFCTSCGAQTKPGAKFCAGCGAPLK